ncbi:MAG: hypothetical protein ACOCUT_02840 [bacterium]
MKDRLKVEGNLEENEEKIVIKVAESHFDKIDAISGGFKQLVVHVNKKKPEGNTHEYGVVVKVILFERKIEANANEWDLERSVNFAIKSLENELRSFNSSNKKNQKLPKETKTKIDKQISDLGDDIQNS